MAEKVTKKKIPTSHSPWIAIETAVAHFTVVAVRVVLTETDTRGAVTETKLFITVPVTVTRGTTYNRNKSYST